MKILFKKIHENADIPKLPKNGDVGYDILSPGYCSLSPGECTSVQTGLVIADFPMTEKVFAKIEGRSSLAKAGIFPVGGIIDPSYRGEIIVLLFNRTTEFYDIMPHDKIAQLVFYSYRIPLIIESDIINETDRGDKGFGSSGR